MIRLAIVPTERKIWTGGYNYLLNLVEIAGLHLSQSIAPVLFFGEDVPGEDVLPFAQVPGVQLVRSSAFNLDRRTRSIVNAMLWGFDRRIASEFAQLRVEVVLEAAQFFGWRLPQTSIAWMADFQHRMMSHLFSRPAYWRRELGFRAEILAGRRIIVSSDDAKRQCERFYPAARDRIDVLRFAVPARPRLAAEEIAATTASYGLPAEFYFLPNQFWRHKNHECVIRALGLLKSKGNEIVVAASGNPLDRGDPDHWNRLQRLIGEVDVTANFRLLGMIPNQDLQALLQGCVALINPSLSEGWSTTVEEAKSAGTPMILSDIAVHREQADGAAVFFDPHRPESLSQVLGEYRSQDEAERKDRALRGADSTATAMRRFAENLLAAVMQSRQSL